MVVLARSPGCNRDRAGSESPSSHGSLQDLNGTWQRPASRSGGPERQMTPTVVSSVRPSPVAVLVHLVHRHAFPRHVGERRVGLLEQRRFGPLGGSGAGSLGGGGAGSLGGDSASIRSAATPQPSSRLARSAAAALHLLLWTTFLFGPDFGFSGTTVMVVLALSPGCPSRLEPARVAGIMISNPNRLGQLSQ